MKRRGRRRSAAKERSRTVQRKQSEFPGATRSKKADNGRDSVTRGTRPRYLPVLVEEGNVRRTKRSPKVNKETVWVNPLLAGSRRREGRRREAPDLAGAARALICSDRKQRRQALFAQKTAGKGMRKSPGPYHRDARSKVKC